ncbi:hypothetical protein pb186bvf_011432 [Paramecium bursaria]
MNNYRQGSLFYSNITICHQFSINSIVRVIISVQTQQKNNQLKLIQKAVENQKQNL